jgi:hypothetical protein
MIDYEDLVERVRMCVAEAGYDNSSIYPVKEPELLEQGFVFWDINSSLPVDVGWRAREISGIGIPKCFACTVKHRKAAIDVECAAVRRLEFDCGVDRKKEI